MTFSVLQSMICPVIQSKDFRGADIVKLWGSVVAGNSREMAAALRQMNVEEKWRELADENKVRCFSNNYPITF